MNNFFKLLPLLLFTILASCSSNTGVFNAKESSNMKEPGVTSAELLKNNLADIWVIEAKGLKGEAGVFNDNKHIPLSSLNVRVTMFDLLSKVNVWLEFNSPESKEALEFRYPQMNGMLVESFIVHINGKAFRAVIAEKESAEEIYKLAGEQNLNAVKISQKAFSDMIVSLGLKAKSKIGVSYKYTQLSSLLGDERVISIPAFKGLEKCDVKFSCFGRFSSELKSFSGLPQKVENRNFRVESEDKEFIGAGIFLSYKTQGPVALVSSSGEEFYWDKKQKKFALAVNLTGVKKVKVQDDFLAAPIAFVKFKEAVRKNISYKEAQKMAVRHKLLTPITQLLMVNSIK